MIHWDVSPEIFRFGAFAVRWYSVLFALGFLSGFFVLRSIMRREGKDPSIADDLFVYCFVGVLIGSRLGHVLFYDPAYYMHHPGEIFMVWKGGLASHGGAIGALVAMWLLARRRKGISYMWILDRVVVVTPLVAAFVRFGNLFNSEIYGKPSSVPWAFIFERIDTIGRHPTQLYEGLFYLAIFWVMMVLYKRDGPRAIPGTLFGAGVLLVTVMRFLVEFTKEQQAAFVSGLPLNMGQMLSIPFIVVAVVILLRSHLRSASGGRSS